MKQDQSNLKTVDRAALVGANPAPVEKHVVLDANLERERTRSWLAKYSLLALFPATIASAAYGYFSGNSEVYLLTAGLAAPATLIVKSYFPPNKKN